MTAKPQMIGQVTDGIEWAVIFSAVDKAFKTSNCPGVKIETPFGEMCVRYPGPLYCAWISYEGMGFGVTPRIAIINLLNRLTERARLANDLVN